MCVFFTYFSFGLVVVDSIRRKKNPILILPLPIENKRETNKRKPSISTIRSRQRKTTDCLLATALWFVSGSLWLAYNWTVCMRACECIMCVVCWYNPSWCRGCCRRCRHRHCCRIFVILLYTHRERCTCVVCDSRELYQRKYWLWHVVCCRSSRRGDRTNECTRRWEKHKTTQPNAHLFSIYSLLFLNISFLFHSFCMHSPRPDYTNKKHGVCVCLLYYVTCVLCPSSNIYSFFSQVACSHMTESSSSSMAIEQMSDGLATAVHYHMCVHTFVSYCAVRVGQ